MLPVFLELWFLQEKVLTKISKKGLHIYKVIKLLNHHCAFKSLHIQNRLEYFESLIFGLRKRISEDCSRPKEILRPVIGLRMAVTTNIKPIICAKEYSFWIDKRI